MQPTQQMQLQYRPVAMEFIIEPTLHELAIKVTEALNENKLLHGDWKFYEGSSESQDRFIQAVCPAAWRPMPPPPAADSSLVHQPRPGRILG